MKDERAHEVKPKHIEVNFVVTSPQDEQVQVNLYKQAAEKSGFGVEFIPATKNPGEGYRGIRIIAPDHNSDYGHFWDAFDELQSGVKFL